MGYLRVKISVVLLVFAVALIGCRSSHPPSSTTVTVKLVQEWFPYSGFSGEVTASKRFAKAEGINLEVMPGSEQVDPIKLVLSGSADIGVVSSDLLISAVAKGAPLTGIGVINYKSP